MKLDGFRAIGRKSGCTAQLWSRNQKDFTRRFSEVAKSIAGLPNATVIDGEIVAWASQSFNQPPPPRAVPDIFELLEQRHQGRRRAEQRLRGR